MLYEMWHLYVFLHVGRLKRLWTVADVTDLVFQQYVFNTCLL